MSTHQDIQDQVIGYLNREEDLPQEYYYLRGQVVAYIYENHGYMNEQVAQFLREDLAFILKQHLVKSQIKNTAK